MESHIVKIRSIQNVTHDVLQIIVEKQADYNFTPGQATEISINKEKWKDERRPFTFTSLPDARFLEFTIKTYPARKGVTNELLKLKRGDELIFENFSSNRSTLDLSASATRVESLSRNLSSASICRSLAVTNNCINFPLAADIFLGIDTICGISACVAIRRR